MPLSAKALLDAQVQLRRIYNLLSEVMSLTGELAGAIDRDDKVAIRMLITMRAEPISKIRLAQRALREQLRGLTEEEGARLVALLDGAAPEEEAEKPLAAQVGTNRRLLDQVIAADQRVNRRLTREKSVYR